MRKLFQVHEDKLYYTFEISKEELEKAGLRSEAVISFSRAAPALVFEKVARKLHEKMLTATEATTRPEQVKPFTPSPPSPVPDSLESWMGRKNENQN